MSYGNAFLRNSGSEHVPELLDSNSTFKWVGSLRFTRLGIAGSSKQETVEVSQRTLGWFNALQSDHAKLLSLHVARRRGLSGLPEIVDGSFAGSRRWQIQAEFDDHFELWVPIWSPGLPKPNIWAVEYKGWRLQRPLVSSHENLNRIWENLVARIGDARNLAKKAETSRLKHGTLNSNDPTTYYGKVFEDAEVAAESANPIPAYHPDMLAPFGYLLKARQIIAAASKAWVFGGMGSWNDLGWIFKNPFQRVRYRRITAQLYDAVIKGFVAATNSSRDD